MPTHLAPLMAGLAQGDHGVLPVLFDVVSVAWPLLVTHRAGELLDQPNIGFFLGGEGVVHRVAFSTWRLEASIERHTAILS